MGHIPLLVTWGKVSAFANSMGRQRKNESLEILSCNLTRAVLVSQEVVDGRSRFETDGKAGAPSDAGWILGREPI